jgi:molecular chaperone GrpE
MTERGLMKTLQMNGLSHYGTPGDVFDPTIHNALYQYVDTQHPVGTVGQVMKRGFMLRDRVLRPAEVGVIKKEE